MARAWLAADWRAFQGEAGVRPGRRRGRRSPAKTGGGVTAGAGRVTRCVTPATASGQPETSSAVTCHTFQKKRYGKCASDGEEAAMIHSPQWCLLRGIGVTCDRRG
jgi:hypothetical protein